MTIPATATFSARLWVDHALVFAEVMDHRDVRMLEAGERERLVAEPASRLRIREQLGRQHLDRDIALESRVPRAIDLAHAA